MKAVVMGCDRLLGTDSSSPPADMTAQGDAPRFRCLAVVHVGQRFVAGRDHQPTILHLADGHDAGQAGGVTVISAGT